jgi:NADH-quinone oxidoreductase subunit C
MTDVGTLSSRLQERFAGIISDCTLSYGEVTIVVKSEDAHELCVLLRDEPGFEFEQLIDLTVVDYLHYGHVEWDTSSATETGFDRGVVRDAMTPSREDRFAVVTHLLSITHNQRLRVKVFLQEDELELPSITDIWSAANWFEREAHDLFGINFLGHPDLRRILTDYGFVGHPFRKDFPVSGYVEVRYDAKSKKVIYEPVDIEPRVLVPRVKRNQGDLVEADEEGNQHA